MNYLQFIDRYISYSPLNYFTKNFGPSSRINLPPQRHTWLLRRDLLQDPLLDVQLGGKHNVGFCAIFSRIAEHRDIAKNARICCNFLSPKHRISTATPMTSLLTYRSKSKIGEFFKSANVTTCNFGSC